MERSILLRLYEQIKYLKVTGVNNCSDERIKPEFVLSKYYFDCFIETIPNPFKCTIPTLIVYHNIRILERY